MSAPAAAVAAASPLKKTALYEFHVANKAKIVPYAGWSMPLQFEGVTKEHVHSRQHASLFDVGHMCQVTFHGADRERFIEWVTPADIRALKYGRGRLSLLMTEHGGIKDDCVVFRHEDHLSAVLNAACAPTDLELLRTRLEEFGGDVQMEINDKGLVALQGPQAAQVLAPHIEDLAKMPFMTTRTVTIHGIPVQVTRCGYTGEDGFEISVENQDAINLTELLVRDASVKMAGLGARDTLRQEAGLCLYGNELSTATDPISADLLWTISKRRREEANFVGAEKVLEKFFNKDELVPRVRIGIVSPKGPCPRDGVTIVKNGDANDTQPIGTVTSGAPSPSLGGKNIAQGFVDRAHSKPGTLVDLLVRGKRITGEVTMLPFVATNYHRVNATTPAPAAAATTTATPATSGLATGVASS